MTNLTIIGKICRSKLGWWKYNCILTHRGAAEGTYKVNPNRADVALQVRIILHLNTKLGADCRLEH
jgi:hypothetical protein